MSLTRGTPGTYILLLHLRRTALVQICRTRVVRAAAGFYAYVGSALGPGGLAARLKRYSSGISCKHWHIDYILPHGNLVGALVVEDVQRHECAWASWVSRTAVSCVEGFGASDCSCKGHLFYLGLSLCDCQFLARAQSALNAKYIPKKGLQDCQADSSVKDD
jgi:Uri superfamily endonuclease